MKDRGFGLEKFDLEFVEIGSLNEDDVESVLALHQSAKLEKWSGNDYREIIDRDEYVCLLARLEKTVVGFINARLIKLEGSGEIINIAVDPRFQRRNIARKLLQQLVNCCINNEIEQIFLEVRETNERARAFYEKNDFEPIGRRKNFYKFPAEDALLMRRKVKKLEEPAGLG